MSIVDKLNEELNKIAQLTEPVKKSIEFMALLTEQVHKVNENVTPVIVGGSAVLIYTLGGHLTYDIDIVANNLKVVQEALQKLGFSKTSGRHFYQKDLDIAVEIPDDSLAGDVSKLTTIQVDEKKVFLIGIEDIVIDRLCSAKHWKYDRDEAQSITLVKMYMDKIDWVYLNQRAKEEDILDKLEEVLRQVDALSEI